MRWQHNTENDYRETQECSEYDSRMESVHVGECAVLGFDVGSVEPKGYQ